MADNGESSYRRYLEGEDEAFGDIVSMHFKNLTYFVFRFVKDQMAAEDIAEDALLQLMIHKGRYNFKTSLKTYLYTIARNLSCNYLKKAAREKRISLESAEAEIMQSQTSPDSELFESESKRALYNAIQKLPSEMQTAVYLVYFEDISYKDAAVIMKKSRKQIDNLLFRAKNELRSIIDWEGDMA